MPIDPTIFLRGYQGSVDPASALLRAKQISQDQQLRALQIQGAQQESEAGALKLSQLRDAIAKQKAIEGAARNSLVTPAPVNVQQPTINLGGVSLPGDSTQVQGPTQFDPQKFQQAYQGIDPIGAMGYQQEQLAAQQKAQSVDAETQLHIAQTRDALSRATGSQLDNAQKALEGTASVLVPMLSVPPDQKQQVWQRQVVPQLAQLGKWTPEVAQQHMQYPGDQSILSQVAATKAGIEYANQRKAENGERAKTVSTAEGVFSFNPQTQKYDIRIGSPTKALQINNGKGDNARLDKSYQYNNGQLTKIASPIEQLSGRMGNLKQSLAQGTPQADALVAPELLSVMAGGQGSGLRMNEAEISRIVGGRSNFESLRATLQKWSTDPTKANSITPAQRQQINSLVNTVDQLLNQKRQIIESANQDLINATDVNQHRQIVADARKKLAEIDAGNGGGVQVTDPRGGIHTFPNQQAADQFKKAAGIQ